MELIVRYLPKGSASILDVGGATGVYSFQLADLGHRVTLLDIVPAHIEAARSKNQGRANRPIDLITCDIRDFGSDQRFDAVILHGPMYHIAERAGRVAALARCSALLKPNGRVFVFAINRYAGYFYGVRSGAIMKPDYRRLVREEMRTGVRSRTPGWYFHTPEELQAECEEAGLRVVAKKSVVTQAWMVPDAEERIRDPEYAQQLATLARDAEDDLTIGQDMMFVAESELLAGSA